MRGNEQRQASVGFGSGSAPTLTPERRRYRTHRCISARRARAARYGGTSQCTAVITGVTRHSRQRRRRVLATMQACGPRFPTLARATTGENVLDRRRSVFVYCNSVIHTHKTRTDCNVVYDRYTRGSGADGGARPAPRGVVPGDRISAGGATIKPPSCSLTWNIPCHHDCIHTTSPGEVQLSTHQESIRAEKGGDRLLATGIMFARFQRAAGPRTARPTCARVHDATRRGRRLRRRWRAGSAPFPSWCTIAWLALSDGGYTGDALEP